MSLESLKKLCNPAQIGKCFEGSLLIPSTVAATSAFLYLNQLVQKQVVRLAENQGVQFPNVTWDKVNETVVQEWGSIASSFQNLTQTVYPMSSETGVNPAHLAVGSVLVLGVALAAIKHFYLIKAPLPASGPVQGPADPLSDNAPVQERVKLPPAPLQNPWSSGRSHLR